MAIRKRYVGAVKLQERYPDVFVEGVSISKVTKKMDYDLVYKVRELADELLDELKLSYGDIDAFVVSSSMGGLFGIPEFMRYVFPSVFGSHKVVYETSCDEGAGLCAVIEGYKLIRSGIYSRVCAISGMQVNIKEIDSFKNIIFADTISDNESFIKDYISRDKSALNTINKMFLEYYENALKNPYLDKKEIKKSNFDPSEFPDLKNAAGVCIIANRYSARQKKIKIEYAEELTVNATSVYSSVSEMAQSLGDEINENIEIVEISSTNPAIDLVFLEKLGLKDKVKLNLSGGLYFMNSPPVSSFLSFAYLYEQMKNTNKKGGLVICVGTRAFDHFGVVYLVNESKTR